jgi:hypothetical protein
MNAREIPETLATAGDAFLKSPGCKCFGWLTGATLYQAFGREIWLDCRAGELVLPVFPFP